MNGCWNHLLVNSLSQVLSQLNYSGRVTLVVSSIIWDNCSDERLFLVSILHFKSPKSLILLDIKNILSSSPTIISKYKKELCGFRLKDTYTKWRSICMYMLYFISNWITSWLIIPKWQSTQMGHCQFWNSSFTLLYLCFETWPHDECTHSAKLVPKRALWFFLIACLQLLHGYVSITTITPTLTSRFYIVL